MPLEGRFMNPLLLVLLLECVPGSPVDFESFYTPACALEAAARLPPEQLNPTGPLPQAAPTQRTLGGYTLAISGRWGPYVRFTGTGYYPRRRLPDLRLGRSCDLAIGRSRT